MTTSIRTRNTSGFALIGLAALVWGTIPLSLAAAGAVNAVVIVFYRVAIASVALLIIAAFTGSYRELSRLSRRGWLGLIANGTLLAVNWALFFLSIRLAGVAVGEILGYTGPVWVAAMMPLVLGEDFDSRVVVPLALALGGIIAMLLATTSGESGSSALLGVVLAFFSSVTYALLMLNTKRLLGGVGAISLMLVEDVVAALLLTPVLFFWASPSTAAEWGAMSTLALVQTVGAGLLFMYGLSRVRVDHGAVLTYGEPVSAVIFGALFLGQRITLPVVLGGIAVITGGLMVARLQPVSSIDAPGMLSLEPSEGNAS